MKTRDAELRAYSKLSGETKDLIIPIFELTKSRKTSIAPDGDIHRRMSYLRDIAGGRPFVLDITQDDKYSNVQIESLLDEANGYYEWQYFLQTYEDLNIIPTIHLYDDENFIEVERFVSWASKKYDKLALRLPFDIDSVLRYVRPVIENIEQDCSLLLIIDAGYVSESDQAGIEKKLKSLIADASTLMDSSTVVIITTTFPRTPASLGDDSKGCFKIRELEIFDSISEKSTVQYGDYASIHPLQYEMRGGTWIPRVDVSLDEDYMYTRYRRTDGGYVTAAAKMLHTPSYKSFGCWGDEEIAHAATGEPNGKNPSYWISVRMNIHMSRRAYEFKSK
jgi:hypothetical protein